MAPSSDPPPEPAPDAVVDPAILELRRARREDPSGQAELERLRAQQLLGERRTAELEAEVALLTGELDRRVAEQAAVAAQVGRLRGALATLRERAQAEQAHQASAAGLLAELRTGHERVAEALEALRVENARALGHLADERRHRVTLEAAVEDERARSAVALARVNAAANGERALLARHLETTRRTLAALEGELAAALAEAQARAESRRSPARPALPGSPDAAVQRLVAELVATVETLREEDAEDPGPVPRRPVLGIDAPSADHPALLRPAVEAPPGEPPEVVGDLDRAAARLRARLEGPLPVSAPSGPPAADDGDLDGPSAAAGEPEGAGLAASATPAASPDGPPVVPPASAEPSAEPPEAVAELPPVPGEPLAATTDPSPVRGPAPAGAGSPPPTAEAEPGVPEAVASPAEADHASGVLRVGMRPGPGGAAWLAGPLADLALRDPAAAERFLLAALAVQGDRVERDIAYGVELPLTGRHQVTITRGGPVVVRGAEAADTAAFRLTGTAADLAPLVTGGRTRRMKGVRVRGGRRRLRKLRRRLHAVAGFQDLLAMGARPQPYDLLALLCTQVPSARVGATRLRVGYLVGEPEGPPTRVVVQACDGVVVPVVASQADPPADATVTVAGAQLAGTLAGASPAPVTGDRAAVAMLHGWLREAQGLSV